MTTLATQCSYREWRVNRIRKTLDKIAVECGDPRLTRAMAQTLARNARELADELADLFTCPACSHPEVTFCAECPVGSRTARPEAAFRSTHAIA